MADPSARTGQPRLAAVPAPAFAPMKAELKRKPAVYTYALLDRERRGEEPG